MDATLTTLPFNNFHKFTSLAVELQIKIWHYTFAPSRVIQVHRRSDGSYDFGPLSPPIALHVCQTSRFEALSKYEPLFEMRHAKGKKGKPIYLDPTRDTIYLATTHNPKFSYEDFSRTFPEVTKFQSIALDLANFPGLAKLMPLSSMDPGHIPNDIRELVFVVRGNLYQDFRSRGCRRGCVKFAEPLSEPIDLGWGDIWSSWRNAEKAFPEWFLNEFWKRKLVVRIVEISVVSES